MSYQTASRVLAAARLEATAGTIATATGAAQVRLIDSPGLQLNRAQVQSAEKLTTGLKQMLRLGYKTVQGSFNSELSVGGANDLFMQGLIRNAWATSTSFSFASVTTVAISTNNLSCGASSSFITAGVKVGDIFYVTGTTVSGDNSVNAQVLALTTQTITVASGTFTTLTASATGTLTILKKLVSPTSSPTQYPMSIEQNDTDIDLSEVFLGNLCVGGRFSMKPGQMATVQWSFLGTDRTAMTTGTSPYFTSPTLTTSLPLVADDSAIYYNGTRVATFTGFDFNFQVTAKGEPVIGALVTPTIFDNDCMLDGTITGLRSDFSNLTLYDAETEFEIFMMLQEPSGTPKNALGFYFPRVKIKDLQANFGGGDGGKIEQLQIQMGPKTADSSHNYGYGSICSSGAYPF